MDDIQPLNELGERVVTQEEVVEIMEKMRVLSQSFVDLENNLKPFLAQLDALNKDVDACIASEKGKYSEIANQHVKNLEDKIAKLEAMKTDAMKKLGVYREGIEELKESDAKHCGILLDTLALLSEESNHIED
jgi:tetrahydromethanopterin S-methyltransferase subunit B